MKKMFLAAALVLVAATTVFAQSDMDALRDHMTHAGPTLRARLRVLVMEKYPQLPSQLVGFVAERYPDLPTRMALARLQALREKHPAAFTTLPAQVMDDVHARHPHLITRAAIAYWTEVAEHHPELPGRLAEARAKARINIAVRAPHLPEDILEVVSSRAPKLPSALRSDIATTVYETDAALPVDLFLDLATVCGRHDDVRAKLAGARGLERLGALRQCMRDNPRFAVELWTMIDQKYADRLYRMAHAVVQAVGEKHGAEMAGLLQDVVTMIDRKHAHLPYDIALEMIAVRRQVATPTLVTALASALEARNGAVLADLLGSIDRRDPTLRADLRAAMTATFPNLQQEVTAWVKTQWPDFIPQALQL